MKTRIGKILNISEMEVPKVLFSWLLRFTLQLGFIVGWTAIISRGVSIYGITALPVILLFQAVCVISGMLLFSILLETIPLKRILQLNSSFAVITLLAAIFSGDNTLSFLILGTISSGLFFSQINLLINSYLEELFTPFGAEKAYPIIETTHQAGGILGGVILTAGASLFLAEKLVLFWLVMILAFFLILTFLEPKKVINLHPPLVHVHKRNAMMKCFSLFKRNSFYGILFAIMVINTLVFYLIDFQYTNAINESVGTGTVQEHEEALTHGLGVVHLLMYSIVLMINLFLAEKIMKKFGSFGGFFIHSITILFSTILMVFSYGFPSAVIAKNNYEITNIFKKNSYEIAFYAFREGTQRALREIFDGFAVPIAGILATTTILFIQWFFLKSHYFYVIQLFLVAFVLVLLLLSVNFKRSYTDLVVDTLKSSNEQDRLNAIQILGQHGHDNSRNILLKLYEHEKDGSQLKPKILEALGHFDAKSV